MMKKALLFVIPFVALALLLLTACTAFHKNGIVRKSSAKDIQYVDETIEKTIADKSYESLPLEEKKKIVDSMLIQLKKDNYILNFSYDEDTCQFSFMYGDESLGGIMLNDFSQTVDGLQLN